MEKLGIFLILTVVALQNPTTAALARTDYDDAVKVVQNLLEKCDSMNLLINSELFYFTSTHKNKVNEIIKKYDISSEVAELSKKIQEISEADIEADSKAAECIPVAAKSVSDAVAQHQTSSVKCSAKAQAVSDTIVTNIRLILHRVVEVRGTLKSEVAQCTSDDNDEAQKTTCLQELANRTKPKVNTVELEINTNKESMHNKATSSLTELDKCYKEIPNFSTQGKDIIEKFEKCIKENAATNIYSTNVLYFCLCLYALLRLSS